MKEEIVSAQSLIEAVAECLTDSSAQVYIFKSGECKALPCDSEVENAVPFWRSTHVYSVEEKLNWQDEGLDDESEVFDMGWEESLEYAGQIVNMYLLGDAEAVLYELLENN